MKDMKDAVIEGNEELVVELTQKYLDEGHEPIEIIREGYIKGMEVVGELFGNYEMFLPDVLQSAESMKKGMEVLEPKLVAGAQSYRMGKIVLATVEGDVHDIGKNLVFMMLKGAGFDIIDMGVDVPIGRIIETAQKEKADIVALSTLLTTGMSKLAPWLRQIEEAVPGVKTMVGGAPITREFAAQVGAGGFAPDAMRAINLAKELLGAAN
jgi:5-methyltetrahydrofolate--homocysteine methyltransferase